MTRVLVRALLLSCLFGAFSLPAVAKAPVGVKRKVVSGFRTNSDCLPPSASSQLDINNIRALIHNGGDMWWDLVGDPRYEVPKGSNRHSMFASSLWVGGLDDAGQLRVAAQTYRQSGIDFWPGPLTDGAASVDQSTCERYNKMFKINKSEIDEFRADFNDNGVIDNPERYPSVFSWPAAGTTLSTNQDGIAVRAFRPDGSVLYVAPFVDIDGNPFEYNPSAGDYPDILGDQAIWWIINDKGNIHTETGGEPIGIELHFLAFAFTTANAVNDMTFYRQTVVNRSSNTLNQCYMGQWVDVDVGFAFNDYVGCDTLNGLGFGYNATANDQGANGYGLNPPACGVDFFQGPLADPNDGVDNDKDGEIDEDGETIIMSKFVYYNNDFTLTGNPEVAQHFYGYLTGFWKDGTAIVDNYSNGGEGNGYGPSSPGPNTNYMFTGDPCTNTGWTESNADNPTNEDRRFLQSAGPFTLLPGAVNEIITGVVWARGFYNDQFGSVCELLAADRVAQALFDNNFRLLDGPDAPELTVNEYDSELNLSWGYPEELRTVRNNFNESYLQADPVLKANGVRDSLFQFQGYIIYQLSDGTVGPNELNNPDRARIVAQCDVEDGVGTIVNRREQQVEGLPQAIIIDEVMVTGNDNGIFHSVKVDRDLFAPAGDTRLKNYTTYYYAAIAYAYNDTSSDGRKFVQGNRFFAVKAAMPHPVSIENGGTVLGSSYGEGIPITRLSGVGNGGNFVRLSPESEEAIVASNFSQAVTYQGGSAPFEVKIVDPKLVKPNYYRVEIVKNRFEELRIIAQDTTTGTVVADSIFAEWILYESTTEAGPYNRIYASTYQKRNDGTPARPAPLAGTERVIRDRGISIVIKDIGPAGDTLDIDGQLGIIGSEVVFDDPLRPWLSGLADNNDLFGGIWNWLRGDRIYKTLGIYDKYGDYQRIVGGRWGPFALARSFNNDPLSGGQIGPNLGINSPTNNRQMSPQLLTNFENLPDVDIVFTSDITKWSRCAVVETSPNTNLGSGAWQLSAKWKPSVDKNGTPTSPAPQVGDHGMGWFPGYAINLNTGERLNIFFGESEWDKLNNGDDMLFNPTSDFGQNLDRVGGRHYVYVTNLRYDEFASLKDSLMNANYQGIGGQPDAIFFSETGHNLASVYKYVIWTGIPMLSTGFSLENPANIPTRARVSIRINRPFGSTKGLNDSPVFGFNTVSQAVQTNQVEVAKESLDQIRVVPNPYYAYSSYETGQLDNRVKITNLPPKCRISIFTLNGHLVRQFTKDNQEPDLDWDLKNQSGVPVASGVYIIHIDGNIQGQNLGEKVVKMFAVMRQIDLDSF